jgi:hypothetical protein
MRRERTILKAQLSIARAEARCAVLAVVVCPAERYLTQDGSEGFVATAGIARGSSASRARQRGSAVVRAVRVQSSGNRHARDAKCLTTCGYLDGFEIPLLNRGPYKGFDLREDFPRERLFEAPFFAASFEAASPCTNRASQSRSLVSTSSFTIARNRLYSAICARVSSRAEEGIVLVIVLPATAWVSDQKGPCPRSPVCAQWQLGFPHRV